MRLKSSFENLWQRGTDYVAADEFQSRLTSSQLKVKRKANNISGLQLADLLAHPSRNEILKENGLREKSLPPFGQEVVKVLQDKYDRQGEKVYGKKLL